LEGGVTLARPPTKRCYKSAGLQALPSNKKSMKHSYLCAIAFSAALVTPLSVSAGEPLLLQVPAILDPSAPIPTAVKNECGLEMLLGNHTLAAIGRRDGSVRSITGPEQAGADKFVQLTILAAYGVGGGNWSGPKSMSIRADLKKGEATIASTVFTRASGNPLAGFSGTCAILNRVATVLGKDVAGWLARGATARPDRSDSNAAEPPEKPASEPATN
jgi:hypothetical protein